MTAAVTGPGSGYECRTRAREIRLLRFPSVANGTFQRHGEVRRRQSVPRGRSFRCRKIEYIETYVASQLRYFLVSFRLVVKKYRDPSEAQVVSQCLCLNDSGCVMYSRNKWYGSSQLFKRFSHTSSGCM